MKTKRFTALFVVLVLLCAFMIVPAAAASNVYTGTDIGDGSVLFDAIPPEGIYNFSATLNIFDADGYMIPFSMYVENMALSLLEYDENLWVMSGQFKYDFPEMGMTDVSLLIIIENNVCVIILPEYDQPLPAVYDTFVLTAVSAPDSEPTMNNFLSDIGFFFTSCMKMLSDVIGIIVQSPSLLIGVFALPVIVYVVSVASRLKS